MYTYKYLYLSLSIYIYIYIYTYKYTNIRGAGRASEEVPTQSRAWQNTADMYVNAEGSQDSKSNQIQSHNINARDMVINKVLITSLGIV